MSPKVLAVIMGGGRGTRLYPLTKDRCKPAVPLAGKYRLVDIPISNCLNSGLNRIYLLSDKVVIDAVEFMQFIEGTQNTQQNFSNLKLFAMTLKTKELSFVVPEMLLDIKLNRKTSIWLLGCLLVVVFEVQ